MPLISDSLRNLASALTVAALTIAGLVLGREILIPLTLAIFIAFVLSPVILRMTRRGLPTSLSIVLTVAASTALVAAIAVLVSGELLSLTSDLPRYRTNIVEKVRSITAASKGDSTLGRATDAIERLGAEIQHEMNTGNGAEPSAAVQPSAMPQERDPKIVVAEKSGPSALEFLLTVVSPLTQGALTFLFTLFLLFQYKDLRDRVVRVAGTEHMSDTTSAMSEAGERLSRLFLFQALLNGAFGMFVGMALWFIGVPSPALWGLLAAILRFIPFIGSLLAALPPVLLAAAIDPGWTMLAATLAVFLIGEPAMGHGVEPLVLGKKAGISPFAMIASASFWTLIWGPMGLLLAAPLTMVLVVLGRYVSGLEFFSVVLGDEPALSPQQEFYHRLLADDGVSAVEKLEDGLEETKAADLADSLIMPALALAAYDHRLGRLDGNQLARISSAISELRDVIKSDQPDTATEDHDTKVLVLPARGVIDGEAALLVSAILKHDRVGGVAEISQSGGLTALASARALYERDQIRAILIVTVGGMDRSQIGYVSKRAMRDFPNAETTIVDASLQWHMASADRSAIDSPQVTTVSAAALKLACVAQSKEQSALDGRSERLMAARVPRDALTA